MANKTEAGKPETPSASKTSSASNDGSELSDVELDQVAGGTNSTTTTTTSSSIMKKISDTSDTQVQNLH